MKRKDILKKLGFKPQSNGDYKKDNHIITSKQIRKSNKKNWDKLMHEYLKFKG